MTPILEADVCWNHISAPAISSPITRKGTTRTKSRRVMRPRCHQAQASNTIGRVKAMPFDSDAVDKQGQRQHITPPAAAPLVRQVAEHREKRQQQRERVFLLRDPGRASRR